MYNRSFIADLIDDEWDAHGRMMNIVDWYVSDWECRRNAFLHRYFRMYGGDHVKIGEWNALVRRYVEGRVRGKGSVIASRETSVTEGSYFDGKFERDESHERQLDSNYRVTQKRLINLGPGRPLRGRLFTYGQIRARVERFRDYQSRKLEWQRAAAKREARRVIAKAKKMQVSPSQLYRHWDKEGRLLYVGISCNFVNRLAKHRTDSAWFPMIANVTIEHFDTREECERAERQAIRTELPLFNRMHSLLDIAA